MTRYKSAVQKRNAAVLLRKPGRLASQYAPGLCWIIQRKKVSHLLDQMIMDIQHLELEVIRARYKLNFFLNHLMMNTFEWRYSAAWDHGMEGIQYTINICRTAA